MGDPDPLRTFAASGLDPRIRSGDAKSLVGLSRRPGNTEPPRPRLGLSLDRQPERRAQPVEGVHGRDGDRQIDKVLRLKDRACSSVGFVGGVGLAHQSHLLRPSQRRAIRLGEEMWNLRPHGQQDDLVERHGLEQVARVQVHAVSAAVDLGHPEEHHVDHFLREIGALGDVVVDAVEGFGALRRDGVPYKSFGGRHGEVSINHAVHRRCMDLTRRPARM